MLSDRRAGRPGRLQKLAEPGEVSRFIQSCSADIADTILTRNRPLYNFDLTEAEWKTTAQVGLGLPLLPGRERRGMFDMQRHWAVATARVMRQTPQGAAILNPDMGTGKTLITVGALDCLTPGRMTPHEVALAAHRVETELLGQQSGIQDQLCSAFGGISYIEMFAYPHATVSPIQIPNALWWELERRLALVYLGNSHNSSQVHEMVIRGLEDAGPDCAELQDLRQTAPRSRDALYAGDFAALGQAMIENTAAQRRLHPALVSADADRVIEIAREHGAIGWKVNGAGGAGGSLTLLCGARSEIKRAMLREIEQDDPLFKNIPIYLSRYGLRVWEQSIAIDN